MIKTNSALQPLQTALVALLLFLPSLSGADDTDIYVNPRTATGAEPYVMFSIDYRANLTSTICPATQVDAAIAGDTSACPAATFFRNYFAANFGSASHANHIVQAGEQLDLFDVIRGSLEIVVGSVSGVKIGLMMNHNNVNNCEGPENATTARCSNGGFIPLGFQTIPSGDVYSPTDPTDPRRPLFDTLQKLEVLSETHQALEHPYQGKELFFEFFRYLTGQGVYNGHVGYDDFHGSDRNSYRETNLPEECPPDGSGDTSCVPGEERWITWDRTIQSGSGPADISDNIRSFFKPRYESPLSPDDCTQIFTINLMFQVSQSEDDSDDAITASQSDGGMFGINLRGRNNSFATVIDWLHDVDLVPDPSLDDNVADPPLYGGLTDHIAGKQNVTSYFILPDPQYTNTTARSYATAGGTNTPLELSSNPEELIETLDDVFRQILAVSTTFVAASIPVNVFNRAETEDELFLALFEAAATTNWNGNVKKLKLGLNADGSRSILDANGDPAIGADGRIRFSALTPWTVVEDGNGDPALPAGADPNDNIIAGADGRHVDRGGAGQKVPGFLPSGGNANGNLSLDNTIRKVYTDVGGSRLPVIALASPTTDTTSTSALHQAIMDKLNVLREAERAEDANETPADPAPAITTEAEANRIVRYMRGLNPTGSDSAPRDWVFGDPLHAKPFPLNYGAFTESGHGTFTEDNPAIYIAAASNDGGIRLIRNRNAPTTTDGSTANAESGKELWSFMPMATLRTQAILTGVLDPDEDNSVTPARTLHPYGMDGNPVPTIVRSDPTASTIETGDEVILVTGQRRGGRSYYALEISNPNNPVLDWTLNNTLTDFEKLGMTFSTPQNAVVLNSSGTPVRALVFAGGYDPAKDSHATPTSGHVDSMGNALFIVETATGNLISRLEHTSFVDSAPTDVTVADTDSNGVMDRVVFGDTGGNVWRADIAGNPSGWSLTHLARLGRHGTTDAGGGSDTSDRRFFHAPDLVKARDSSGPFDAIIITSGNRANPLDYGGAVLDYAFMLKDRNVSVGAGAPIGPGNTPLNLGDLGDVTDNCLGEGDGTCSGSPPDLAYGWRMKLEGAGESGGEKGLAVPFTFGGTVFFTTYLPPNENSAATVCGPSEGSGRLYAVELLDATPALDYYAAADDERDRFTPLASGGIPAEVVFIPGGDGGGSILKPDLSFEDLTGSTVYRTFWQFVEPDIQ